MMHLVPCVPANSSFITQGCQYFIQRRVIQFCQLAESEAFGLLASLMCCGILPHRAQRAASRQSFPQLCLLDATSDLPTRSAIDTVEHFQGGERTVILVNATESGQAYFACFPNATRADTGSSVLPYLAAS
jgi:hypothetical protein